ncbi:hypothetical protein F5141DRAFT_1209263 [Pisolithus sp. B1]|nr:hypothetical protein F5141DRAFT_1209263 [Pisolithus sp. B1]
MLNPSVGTANPSASLAALWGYILPALNHIARSPTHDLEKAPAVDISYRMGIHTATYNYFTAQATSTVANCREKQMARGADLYMHLDKYFMDLVRELHLGASEDDMTLIQYLIPCFKRYAICARSINRLLNYVNRHYVKRAVDEDKGWLTLSDMFHAMVRSIQEGSGREEILEKLEKKRMQEIKKWGYRDGGSPQQLVQAELCAEAASPLDRVVTLEALALRRFRTEFVEPLLAAPRMKKRRGGVRSVTKHQMNPTEGRLVRAVQSVLEVQGVDEVTRRGLASDLDEMLRAVGVHGTHSFRKKLKILAKDPHDDL